MAARRVKIKHDDNTRLKIQASQLINRLTGHAQGTVDLSTTQVRAIEILLRKILPDLSDVKMDVDTQPITFNLSMGSKK
jgi:predicted signal transduction protein with EAL and GGDEF domain